jgi:hypothetical protein
MINPVAKMAYRLAPIIYSAEGKKISDQLWKETKEELAFANVEEILKTVSE